MSRLFSIFLMMPSFDMWGKGPLLQPSLQSPLMSLLVLASVCSLLAANVDGTEVDKKNSLREGTGQKRALADQQTDLL